MLKNYQLAPKFFHSLHTCVPDSHNEAFTIHGWLSASTYVHQRREGLRIFCVEECRYIFLNQQIITNAYFFSGLPDDATAVSHFVHQANVARPRGHVLVPAGRHNEQWAQNSHWLHLWVNRDEIILISLCRILARLVCVARQDIFGGGDIKYVPWPVKVEQHQCMLFTWKDYRWPGECQRRGRRQPVPHERVCEGAQGRKFVTKRNNGQEPTPSTHAYP